MRKVFIVAFLVLLVVGCGGKKRDKAVNSYLRLSSESRTGTFLCNDDDDDFDTNCDNTDTSVNGAADESDLTLIEIAAHPELPDNWTGELSVDTESVDKVRLFLWNGGWVEMDFSGGAFIFTTNELRSGVSIRMEAKTYPEVSEPTVGLWDGTVVLRFVLRDETSAARANETLRLKVSPWLMLPNTQPAETVYVVATDDNALFRSELQSVVTSLGIGYVEIDGSSYGDDRWCQDSHEIGYSSFERDGVQVASPVVLRAPRNRPLINYPRNELLGPDFGYVAVGTTAEDTPSEDASLNSFGNLEVTPPLNGYPMGRIYYGGAEGFRRMDGYLRSFLDAQAVGGAPLEVDSTWLAVGHVDEFFTFVPARTVGFDPSCWRPHYNHFNPSVFSSLLQKDFKVAYASPALAATILQKLYREGKGYLVIHQGKGAYERTVAEVLNDSAFMGFNEYCQGILDVLKSRLKSELGLVDEDFIELPVLFEDWGGSGYAVAWTAGAVNMLVLNESAVVVPKQFGPLDNGVDVFEQCIRERLSALGLTVYFVDCWDSYHIYMGEIHCGTNVKRRVFSKLWWEHR